MPGGDGTGPMGMGAMTGRAAGYCAGYTAPGAVNPAFGRGLGRGRAFGRGAGMGFRSGRSWGGYAPGPYAAPAIPYGAAAPTPQQEADMLKEQAKRLEDALVRTKKRLADLGTEAEG